MVGVRCAMLFDGVTSEARFLVWQARQECARSRQLIQNAKTEMEMLATISAEVADKIAKAEQVLNRPSTGQYRDQS